MLLLGTLMETILQRMSLRLEGRGGARGVDVEKSGNGREATRRCDNTV